MAINFKDRTKPNRFLLEMDGQVKSCTINRDPSAESESGESGTELNAANLNQINQNTQSALNAKVDKYQGTANAGKVLAVDATGNVGTMTLSPAQGGSGESSCTSYKGTRDSMELVFKIPNIATSTEYRIQAKMYYGNTAYRVTTEITGRFKIAGTTISEQAVMSEFITYDNGAFYSSSMTTNNVSFRTFVGTENTIVVALPDSRPWTIVDARITNY